MGEYYIGQYRDHYAIFDSMGRVQTQYDTHAEAKADLDSYNKTGKPLPESTVMNEGLFGLGKKKEIPKVTVDEIKIIPTNFRKAYDNWWFYLPLKNNMDKDMLCDISNRIRKICNSEYGFDAYPTEFMVCSPKDIVREYKVDDYFDKEYLKNKNNIVICDYEFVGKSNIKSVASLKQRLGARYFNDVVNNAVYYQIKDDPKNKGIPIPELINNSKNYAVSYIDKDTLMAMYNYFASRTSANESVSFYEHTLNEDHSEISNDPEMEKLLALAGCTIEDLDMINNEEDIELDDDDPIDANTSREIDAVIDESVKSNIDTIKLADKAMEDNINQIEKFIPTAKEFLSQCKQKLVFVEKFNAEEFRTFTVGKKGSPEYNYSQKAKTFVEKCHAYDYDRGSDAELSKMSLNWVKYRLGTSIGKLGYNNKKVSVQQVELYKKCIDGGEYDKRLKYCGEELQKIHDNTLSFIESLEKKYSKDQLQKCINYQMALLLGSEYNYFFGQYCMTTGDRKSAETFSGRTRTSFFGKKIKDSVNESFLGIKSKKEKNAKELTKDEFDKLINDMVSINDAIISKLKTSKWWKFIYEPCMNRKNTPDIHSQASKYKQEFMSGKCIGPSFHSSFVDIDDPDPKIYTKLDAEIGRSSDDEAWEKAFDSAYYESQKLIKEAVKKLGFNDDGKSTKYPDVKINIGSGEYIGIWIEPIYNGYYKLKDTKNSQNESAADDYHKNHEERMKNLNKKIDELNNDRKKDNEVREKQDKNAAALRDLLGESTPDLDFIMESIFMDIDY